MDRSRGCPYRKPAGEPRRHLTGFLAELVWQEMRTIAFPLVALLAASALARASSRVASGSPSPFDGCRAATCPGSSPRPVSPRRKGLWPGLQRDGRPDQGFRAKVERQLGMPRASGGCSPAPSISRRFSTGSPISCAAVSAWTWSGSGSSMRLRERCTFTRSQAQRRGGSTRCASRGGRGWWDGSSSGGSLSSSRISGPMRASSTSPG